MLEVDPDQRPDIFQVSHVAFTIANKPCPVKNLNVSIRLHYLVKLCDNNNRKFREEIKLIDVIITKNKIKHGSENVRLA